MTGSRRCRNGLTARRAWRIPCRKRRAPQTDDMTLRFPLPRGPSDGPRRFDRHGQASAGLAIDGSDAGGPGHACRSDDAGHGSDGETERSRARRQRRRLPGRGLNGNAGRQGGAIMNRHWLTRRLRSWGDRPALIWRDESLVVQPALRRQRRLARRLAQQGVKPGDTLAICGDYSPKLCALLLAALLNRNIIVPLASATAPRWDQLMEPAQVQFAVRFEGDVLAGHQFPVP